MKRILEIAIVAAVAIALTVSWERWDRASFVSSRVDDLVSAELAEIERYVDSLRPSWVRAQRLGNLAEAICADRFAASQVVRVQQEVQQKGGEIEPVCGQ
jgi:hypothetical protein